MAHVLVPAVTIAMLLGAAMPAAAGQNAPADTVVIPLPEIEITALRGHDRLRDIPAASFVFQREGIQESGVARLSSLLSRLPGFYAYQQNASGDPAVVDPRGFTAGGERSYLKMLVNGQDVRDVENGGVDWDWLVPDDVERLEVVQGAGAWAYGDGSEGGIVNIVRPVPPQGFRSDWRVRAGSFGMRTGSLALSGRRSDLAGTLRGSLRRVDGWRDRSMERVGTTGGEVHWKLSDRTRVSLDGAWLDALRLDPGTLAPEMLAVERTRAETRTDFSRSKRLILGGHVSTGRPEASEWNVSPYFRAEIGDQARTLFARTPIEQGKWHPTRAWTGGIEADGRRPLHLSGRAVVVSAGSQLEQAKLRSSYFDYHAGTHGPLQTRVESWRTTGSVWADASVTLDPRTSARAGFRQDGVRLRADNLVESTRSLPHTWWAGSPFVALTRRVTEHGSAYVSYSSAFRVASLSQLYDRRPIDFGGRTFYLSNPGLRPQRARSVEIGGRRDGPGGSLAMLTFYSIWVRNEIDFDAATLTYASIERSWHRGIQIALRQPVGRDLTAQASGAYLPTTIQGGVDGGNQINGVPLGTAYGGASWAVAPGWVVEGGVRYVGRQYLDKPNQHRLNDYATVEFGASATLDHVHASLRIGNLLRREYSDTGYLLDLGALGVEERFSPAAPRSVMVAISLD
jgi:outer membrane receptor protein involved in Fe transport